MAVVPFRELEMVKIVTSARHWKRGKLDAFALDVRILFLIYISFVLRK